MNDRTRKGLGKTRKKQRESRAGNGGCELKAKNKGGVEQTVGGFAECSESRGKSVGKKEHALKF